MVVTPEDGVSLPAETCLRFSCLIEWVVPQSPSTLPFTPWAACPLSQNSLTPPPFCTSGGAPVTIRAGDLCTFPEGLSCTWDVKKPVNKHYKFM